MKVEDVKKNFDLAQECDAILPESPADTLRSGFQELVGKLSEKGVKRVVVAIDNLDRCRPETVVKTIETLHLVTETAPCTFLVVVDRDVLVGFIDQEYRTTGFDGSRYLEKVFSDYFRVPDPRPTSPHSQEDDTSQDDVLRYLKTLLAQDECENLRQHLELFCDAFGGSEALRNPWRMKRLIRRLSTLDQNMAPDVFEHVFILVVLCDVWRESFDFFRTATKLEWGYYLDPYGTSAGDEPDRERPDDASFAGFLSTMIKRKRIYEYDQLWEQLDTVRDLGM